MRRLLVAGFGLATIAFTTTAFADPPIRGNQHPQTQGGLAGPEQEEEVPESTYARGQLGFHGRCGASALVPPFRAGFDCLLGARLGSSFALLAEGGFYGDEKLYTVLITVGGQIHGPIFDSDTLAAHGDFAIGEMSSNGIGELPRRGLEWDAFTFKFGFGLTFNLNKHADLDISGAALVPLVTGRGNTEGLTQIEIEKSVTPVQGQFNVGLVFDWPGHPIKKKPMMTGFNGPSNCRDLGLCAAASPSP
jgi:hypothetical protein